MSARDRLLGAIEAKIGGRSLVFCGIRGHDAAPLLAIPQFSDCFAVAAPLGASSLVTDLTLEGQLRHRYDLDTYDYDLDRTKAISEFRSTLLHRMRENCLVLSYRPSHFLWNAGFASKDTAQILGMYKDKQAAYEYKPWVETAVARLGIETVPWRYVTDEERDLEAASFSDPIVLRASRMAGGVGVALARSPEEVVNGWPSAPSQLVAVGPYLEGALPINVGAVVYSPDRVVLHPGSVQLIGVEGATNRFFGYCGNDFGAFALLDHTIVEQTESATRRIGRWLGDQGYRGAFGVDFLWHRGTLFFSEVNPRLQGSTALSSLLAGEMDIPDIVLDHLAASLGMEPATRLSLLDWIECMPPAAHIVVHNTQSTAVRLADEERLLSDDVRGWDIQLVPGSDVAVAPGAILGRLITRSPVTGSGYGVAPPALAAIHAMHAATQRAQPRQDDIKDGGRA